MDPILGLEVFLLITNIIANIVWIFSKGLTAILAQAIVLFTALSLVIVNVTTGNALLSALWGLVIGLHIMLIAHAIIMYQDL